MKKLDIIVIILILITAIISFYYINNSTKNDSEDSIAQIYVDGELYKEVSLTPSKSEIIDIHSEFGHNIIEIDNGRIRVKEADCPDKICVKDGPIQKPGEILVCLPNKVVIEIKGEEKFSVDDFSY